MLKFSQQVSLLLLWTFVHEVAPQVNCPCTNIIIWDSWYPCTPNFALNQICNKATRFRYGRCQSAPNCYEIQTCRHTGSCSATWGRWSPFSVCSNLCQKQSTRLCYEDSSINVTLSTRCSGGNNLNYQLKLMNCKGGNCGVATSTTTTTTTTVSTTTLRPTSILTTTPTNAATSAKITATTDPTASSTKNSAPNSTKDAVFGANSSTSATSTAVNQTPAQPAPLLSRDLILLIAILGSAAMLSVAIVIVACMVTRKKKSTRFYLNHPTPAPRSVPTAVENSAYEMLGPPERSPPPAPRMSVSSDQPRMVQNTLYEPTDLAAQNSFGRNGRVELQTNSDGYLRPISPPLSVQDSVYQQVLPKTNKT